MRWNPRRRKVTSVAYVQPGKTEKPKSPWTSLEVAKIIVGVLTPLVIAVVGVYATIKLHQQDMLRLRTDELRLRRGELVAPLADIDEQHQLYRLAKSDLFEALDEYKGREKMPFTDHLAKSVENIMSLRKSSDRKISVDWLKIQAVIDDRSFKLFHDLYLSGYDKIEESESGECIDSLIVERQASGFGDHGSPACMNFYMEDLKEECWDFLKERIMHFDAALTSQQMERMNLICYGDSPEDVPRSVASPPSLPVHP